MEYLSSETGEMEAPLQVVMGKLITSISRNDMREEGVYWNYRRSERSCCWGTMLGCGDVGKWGCWVGKSYKQVEKHVTHQRVDDIRENTSSSAIWCQRAAKEEGSGQWKPG